MIVAFPADTPDTIPVVVPIVAIPVALLAHVPPVVVLVKVLDPPIQVLKVPVIAFTVGKAFTATIALAELVQALFTPLVTLYVIVAFPKATP